MLVMVSLPLLVGLESGAGWAWPRANIGLLTGLPLAELHAAFSEVLALLLAALAAVDALDATLSGLPTGLPLEAGVRGRSILLEA